MSCERVQMADGSVVLLNVAGPDYRITSGGKTFRFEFHKYCGPMMIGKRGEPIQSIPGKYSPFWDALTFWLKQGRRVDSEGNCVFDIEMKLVQIVKRVGKRRWLVLS